MARLNTFLKFSILNVNYLFAVLGLGLMGLSLYVLVANWGKLDPGFFTGAGAVLFLAGFIAMIGAIMGNFG